MPAKKKPVKVAKATATAKKIVKKVSKPAQTKKIKYQSFKLSREVQPFTSYKITEQTIYWSFLLVYVLFISLWILNIQLQTLQIINSITN